MVSAGAAGAFGAKPETGAGGAVRVGVSYGSVVTRSPGARAALLRTSVSARVKCSGLRGASQVSWVSSGMFTCVCTCSVY